MTIEYGNGAGTRNTILASLKKTGETTVPLLTKALNITPNAVREHMYVLEREGLVDFRWEKQPRGRPLKVYRLSERAENRFPKHYEQLLEELITEIALQDGPGRLRDLVISMARRWSGDLKKEFEGLPFDQAIEKFAEQLNLRGMFATVERQGDGYSLSVHNCIYRAIAMRHVEICSIVPMMIRELLRVEFVVDRSIHGGSNRCIFTLSPPK